MIIKFAVPVPSIEAWVKSTADWAEQCGLEVVETVSSQTNDSSRAQTVVTPALQKHQNVVGVLGAGDTYAIGADIAARNLGLNITTIGVNGASDGYNGVKAGQIDVSLQLPYVEYGVGVVKGVYGAVKDSRCRRVFVSSRLTRS